MPEERKEEADTANAGEEEGEEEIPSDILPLFFTSKTQEIFGCKGDQDVTEENPCKVIPKGTILQDFKDRAAVSDFHPAKQIVLVSLACWTMIIDGHDRMYSIYYRLKPIEANSKFLPERSEVKL